MGGVWEANIGEEEWLVKPSLYYVSSKSMQNKLEMNWKQFGLWWLCAAFQEIGGGQTWLSNISSRKNAEKVTLSPKHSLSRLAGSTGFQFYEN